jgi:putative Mg2+ transporter-C (MgtC) family protein
VQSPSDLELSGRILLALLLGGVIGLEREVSGHPAGIRTHITVALGSALFTIIGAYGFIGVLGQGGTFSPDRVASTVVTGIGFLCGGAILKIGVTVKGLTTAGSLWVTAALGMGVAAGAYVVTLVTAAITLASLTLLRVPIRWLLRHMAHTRETVLIHLRPDADPSRVMGILSRLEGAQVRTLTISESEEGRLLRCELQTAAGQDVEEQVAHLEELDEVTGVDLVR